MEEQLKTTPQTHNAFRAALLMLGALTLYSLILVYLAFQAAWPWQLAVHTGGMVVFGLMTAVGAVTSRQGRSILGISLTLGGLYLAGLSATLTIANFGLTIGFIMIYLTLALAGLTLPRRPANWAIGVGIIVGLVNLLLELYVPLTYRLEIPILPAGALVISGILALIYLGFIVRHFSNYSLQAKLITAFVLVTLICVGIMTFIINRVIQTELTRSVGVSLKGVASSQADIIGDLIGTQVDTLSALGVRKSVVDKVKLSNISYTGDLTAIEAEIDRLDRQWRAADAANNDADPLVQSRLNSLLAIELRDLRELAPHHVEIFVTDQYGANVAATNRTSDYYQGEEEWWLAAYNNGQGAVYISQPEFDESSKTYAIIMALPIYDNATRTVIGVLRSTFRIMALADVLNAVETGESGLLLPNGELITSEGDITPVAPDTLAQLTAFQDTTYAQFVFQGKPQLISQAPVNTHDPEEQPIIANLGWRLIVAQDSAEALLPVNTTVRTGLLTGLAVVLLAGVLAIGVARVLTRPITYLTTVAAQIAAGDLEVQAPVGSADEIGQLARAFNDMTAQLRRLIGSLEDQIQERTVDLTLSMEIGQHATAIRDLATLLPTITGFIQQSFDLYYTQVYFVDDIGQNLILRAGTGQVGQELVARGHTLPIGTGSIVGQAASGRRSVVVPDTEVSTIHKPNPLLPETRSELATPLIIEGKVIGVLDMQSNRANTFTEHNLTVFEAMATQLAISIDSARQWAASQTAQQRAEEALSQLTRESWAESLRSRQRVAGYIYDLSTVVPLSTSVAASTNGRLQIQNAESETSGATQSEQNEILVPVVVQNQPIGQFLVQTPPQKKLSTNEQALLSAVAQQLAQKAENLRLFEQTQQRATREQVAREITDKIRASRDIETALKTTLAELSKALSVSKAAADLKVSQNDDEITR